MENVIVCLKDIFELAKKEGIKLGSIGRIVYGKKAYSNIYSVKNPTQETIKKIYDAYIFLKKCKKNEKNV